jgi:iron complex outermembrane receptor protein
MDERLLLSGALYQIDENNVPTTQLYLDTGVGYFNALGQVRHRGIELQSIGQITPTWQINAGYTYLDPKITKAVVSGSSAQSATVGQMQLYLPRNTISMYTTYTLANTVLRGLSVGGGIRYVGAERTAYDTAAANMETFGNPTRTKNLAGYMLIDANLSYSWGMWSAQLNAHNILDRHYYINNYQSLIYGNVVGEPANVAITIRRSF